MTTNPNPKKKHGKKAVKEGTTVGTLAVLLAGLLASLRARQPNLPWEPSLDPAMVGTATGILFGLYRWLRKLIKRHRDPHGNPQTR